MSASALSTLAAEAYVYYYPLVENLEQVRRYITEGVGSNPAAAFNSFSHARKLADPTDTFVTINNDTVYSMAQLDLSAGPLILSVPDTGTRYHVLQFVDAWTNNIAYIGTRSTGNQAGSYVIVPPGWTGPLPEGMPVVEASTAVVSIVGRFACDGPDDISNVAALQDQVVLSPLDGSAGVLDGILEPAPGIPDDFLFFEKARVAAAQFPEPEPDREYAARFQTLGIGAADTPYADPSDDLAIALRQGLKEGQDRVEKISHEGKAPVINGWTVGLHMFDYNLHALGPGTVDEPEWKMAYPDEVRFAERAVACRLGLWGNNGYEAVYCQAFTDIDGEPLVGSSKYQMTFPEPPPVEAFWSITLYDIPRYYLVDNPIDRYSIGDRTRGITYEADGSLVLTITHREPDDPVERANWLPAPDDRFRLVFRLYVPGQPILDGSYAFPPIRNVE